ncbi:hypothetical protein KCM76_17790 [Zooshikella marina]|uniref:Uncharacterized protein n=1 Tax=Zooshikella ganghwensis TaxID=202772 RepID=A0A4P9VTU1_9GAMM|nr:hypothetical protein [Zooshikella ganghwensis]MBU2707851.1 hypothetical protein [Zooshikella ganghwensis]RDH46107.1 hypothetical protein B9G39_23120 [Zooshikella ganghwensis]
MTGYSKEKADRLIKKHEDAASKFEKEAREAEESETFQTSHSNELRKKAEAERNKADNLRHLKKHWGDD